MRKRSQIFQRVIIHVIFIGLIFGLFYAVISSRSNSRVIKQQVLEKQIALMIDASSTGMTFILSKQNANGNIDNIELNKNRIFVYIDGIKISKGYHYFSEDKITLEQDETNFYIKVDKNE